MSSEAQQRGGNIAVRGRNGQLFLKHGPGLGGTAGEDLIAAYKDVSAWAAPRIERWARALQARTKRLEALGIAHIIMISPEAHFIMAEGLPDGVELDRPGPGERLVNALGERGANVVWPFEALAKSKGAVDIWLRNDTHWTSFGAQVAADQLLQACNEIRPLRRPHWSERRYRIRMGYGDLGSTVSPEVRAQNIHVNYPGTTAKLIQATAGRKGSNLQIYESDAKDAPNILVFRRSFFTTSRHMWQGSFAEWCWWGARAHSSWIGARREAGYRG